MKTVCKIFIGWLSVMAITSCGFNTGGNPLDPNVSNATGWEFNNADYAGIDIKPYREQHAAPGLNFVEGGTFTMGRNMEDVIGEWNNVPRRVTVSSFYIDQYEVSNAEWKAYMWWLNMVFKNTPRIIHEAAPDTLVWARALSYNDKMMNNYFRHPAYNDYPVVGVSWEQAKAYCLWRTDRVNEKMLVDRGIMEPVDYAAIATMDNQEEIISMIFTTSKYLSSADYTPISGKGALLDAYGQERKVNVGDGILYPEYRLPTEAEWEYAAYGLTNIDGETGYGDRRFYPWDGYDFRVIKDRTIESGRLRANFIRGRGDYMGTAGGLNDGGGYTLPVWSFEPNDFGLYNMAGNVNEWVADVYRPTSSEHVEEQNPFRGNEFKRVVQSSTIVDGVEVAGPELDEKGRVKHENYPDSIFADKYPRSDLRNYKDGDPGSSYDMNNWRMREMSPDESTAAAYAPDGDTGEGMLSPALTNTVRVYKGGSFNDRAYYLNPATRRYLEQSKAKDDIGFRCAMDKVGDAISHLKENEHAPREYSD